MSNFQRIGDNWNIEGSLSATTFYGDGSNLTGISGGSSTFSGGTVSGDTIFQSGLTATTISATTYQNLPVAFGTDNTNIRQTDGTNSNTSNAFASAAFNANNQAKATNSSVFGSSNVINLGANNGFIAGGTNNQMFDYNGFIGGADGGVNRGTNSAILGGISHTINTGVENSVILGGNGITATTDNTVYAPNLVVSSAVTANTYYGDGSNLTGISASATEFVVNCRNQSGSDMYRGQVVYMNGSTGNKPTILLAQANSEMTSARTFGVLKNDITNNSDGDVVIIGSITNLDTRTTATHPFTVDTLVDGQTIYLSPTNAGYVTNVKPSAPNHLVYVGKVVRTSPTLGYIEYQIQNGYELDELHDVQITGTPHNGEVLTYHSGLWKPSFIPPIGVNEIFRGRTFRYDSTTVDTYAGIATLNNASAIAIVPNTTQEGNQYTRVRYYASVVSTGRVTSIRSTDLQWYLSNTGFRFNSTFRIADTAYGATCQNFHGLIGTTSEIGVGGATNIQVSTLTNCIFVGSDGTDTNLQVMHNDGSGTCSKIDLGSGFPANRPSGSTSTDFYSIELYNQRGTSNVKYRVINLSTNVVAQGIITTNLPLTTQGLAIQSARIMGTPITNTGQWEQHKWGCYDITY